MHKRTMGRELHKKWIPRFSLSLFLFLSLSCCDQSSSTPPPHSFLARQVGRTSARDHCPSTLHHSRYSQCARLPRGSHSCPSARRQRSRLRSAHPQDPCTAPTPLHRERKGGNHRSREQEEKEIEKRARYIIYREKERGELFSLHGKRGEGR